MNYSHLTKTNTQTSLRKNRTRGFTLVELMVTITVMLIITSIALFNFQQFNSSTMVTSLAYDISLVFRQAQVYGLSIRESGANAGNTAISAPISSAQSAQAFGAFQTGYGVHFSSAQSFTLFIDANNDKIYNEGTDGILEEYKLPGTIKILSVCQYRYTNKVVNGVLSQSITTDENNKCLSAGDSLDVVFRRPDPDTWVAFNTEVSQLGQAPTVAVTISTEDESVKKRVVIQPTGQISVQAVD